ncbi:ATP-dependent endonuclease [Microbacterium sp. SD291]|uniref:ATP-dependent endonuclease n=1 Tax=Microbacterium sp. SD291 TaxID=2782007 RepID=UPI001A964AE1|nr:ATP-dependent endonuclease [Microbacterium sp. SD291]MBO0980249.1 ATP-dependent endonuclease [Microbacterium sp. SD291]
MPRADATTGAVVLFEGASDRLAFEAVARRRDVELGALLLEDLNGITNLRRRLTELRAAAVPPRVLGLYDTAEGRYVAQVLIDVGMLTGSLAAPSDVGFFGCERDLEDEVIAAAGPDLVVETIAARGELTRFRVFQAQPAQRAWTIHAQLHRFAGTTAGRKARFAADVIDALPVERMPRPLMALLDAALSRV